MQTRRGNGQGSPRGEFPSGNERPSTHRAPDYPAQGVPRPLVKPVEELVEAVGGEVVG